MKIPKTYEASLPILFFITATVASWLYCSLTGNFNGDYWPRTITLSQEWQFGLLLVALMPYIYLWRVSKVVSRFPRINDRLKISEQSIRVLFICVFFWHALMTLIFDVGIAAREVYDAPSWIKPIIQIGNRIEPGYVGVFYILSTKKNAKNDLFAIISMIVLGLMRSSIGILAYIFIALTIKYRIEVIALIRRRLLILLLLLPVVPFVVNQIYDIRSYLRNDDLLVISVADAVFSRVAGRLSSYSNLSYIVQESDDFKISAQQLTNLYFPMQIAGNALSSNLLPEVTPEKLMTDVNLMYDGFSTLMASVPGNLLIAWYVSPLVFMLNLFLMVVMIGIIIKLSNRFGNGFGSYTGVAMLIYPMTSGVPHEFSVVLINTIFIYCMYRIIGKSQSNIK